MEVLITLLEVLLVVGVIILGAKKCLDWCVPRYSSPISELKCYSPGKCKDRYTDRCSICKYNKYKEKTKTYFKPRENINGSQ